MRLNAYIAGIGMTRFMKYPDKGLKELGSEAVRAAVADAGLALTDLEAAYVGNCAAGLVTGQESVRGQVILHTMGIGKIPIINVENACASASTALLQASAMVSAGLYDIVLALGVEKLTHPDKLRSFAAFAGAMDVDELNEMVESLMKSASAEGGGAGQNRSMFMDVYAMAAKAHMEKYGTTKRQFAEVASKNSFHGSLNPNAQFQEALTVEQVLNDRLIVEPLTRSMCSPIGDGAAAAVIVSERKARELGVRKPVRVVTQVMHSGWNHTEAEPDTVELCARDAYAEAGVGPDDFDVIELHDASAPAEIIGYEQLGLCPKGDGGKLRRVGRHAARRSHPGEHVRRLVAQGASRGRHRPRPGRRADAAAAGPRRQAAGRRGAAGAGAERRRQEGQRRRRHGGDHPAGLRPRA